MLRNSPGHGKSHLFLGNPWTPNINSGFSIARICCTQKTELCAYTSVTSMYSKCRCIPMYTNVCPMYTNVYHCIPNVYRVYHGCIALKGWHPGFCTLPSWLRPLPGYHEPQPGGQLDWPPAGRLWMRMVSPMILGHLLVPLGAALGRVIPTLDISQAHPQVYHCSDLFQFSWAMVQAKETALMSCEPNWASKAWKVEYLITCSVDSEGV